MPMIKIKEWLNKEKELGSPNPDRVVLSTATKEAIPHSRIVAIREINENGVLFFTQLGTRKVSELSENPATSLVLWLPLQQRQIVLEGIAQKLTVEENERHWKTMPYDRQLRFSAYAPTSGQKIKSIDEIEKQYNILANCYNKTEIPMSEFYCGFQIFPHVIYFYTLGVDAFSEVKQLTKYNDGWKEEMLSP